MYAVGLIQIIMQFASVKYVIQIIMQFIDSRRYKLFKYKSESLFYIDSLNLL